MVDNAQKVEVEAELDATQTVRGARDAAAELTKVIGKAAELEKLTRSIFTGQGNLPRELAAFTRMLEQVQALPARMADVQRAARNISTGGPATQMRNATLTGAINTIRSDPSLQLMSTERELNKVLSARAEIFKRIRDVMPSDASAMRVSQAYRQALASIGDMPDKSTAAYRSWLDRTKNEVRGFEQDRTRVATQEAEKRAKEQLRITRQTQTEERRLAAEQQREINRLFRRDMHGVMNGRTAEQRNAAAQASMDRLRGRDGFNEDSLRSVYDDAEARRSARDIRRTMRPQVSDNERAGRAYQQRDAFMNYNGGANRIASRFQFAGDFAAVGAVMGTAMYAGRSTVQLQTEMKQLQAITKSTNLEMNSLQGTIFAVGQATRYSTQEIAQAATVMGQAGYSAQQIAAALPAIANLATAAGGDLQDTVATVTSVLSIYDLSIDRTANISNQLAEALNGSKLSFEQLSLGLQYAGNVAADGGLQFEEMTAALGAMANAGIRSGSTLGTGLRALIQELENPSDKFLEWLRSVGLSADDVDVRTQGLAGALQNLTSKSFDSGKAMNVFEIRAAAAFSALSNNMDVLQDLQTDMINTDAATEGAKTQMESLTAQTQRLGNAVTEFSTVAGAPLLAFLQGAIGGMASFISAAADGGPAIQIITTALSILVAINVGRWLLTLTAGFLNMGPAADSAYLRLIRMQLASGNLGKVAITAAAGLRAMTLAMLTNPVGLFTVALTGLVTVFTMHESAAARSAAKIEEFKTAANTAGAEAQKYGDRISELGNFMELLADRSNSMGGQTNFAGQMAETATAKFASWGLTLEGNITTVRELTLALADLSQKQAEAALNQSVVERTALQGQWDETMKQRPWEDVRRAIGNSVDFADTRQAFGASVGAGDRRRQEELRAAIPASIMTLIRKAQSGQLQQTERNQLVGWISSNLQRVPQASRAGLQQLSTALNSAGVNAQYEVWGKIQTNERNQADYRLGASDAVENVRVRGSDIAVNLQTEQRRIAGLDPAARVGAAADFERNTQNEVANSNNWLRQQARSYIQGMSPTDRSVMERRASLSGKSLEDYVSQKLAESSPGFGRQRLAGGDIGASDNVKLLQAREKNIAAQLRGNIPADRRAELSRQQEDVVTRRLQLQNEDMDPIALQELVEQELGRRTTTGAQSQESAGRRAARARANTLKGSASALKTQIEAATFNTPAPAGAVGSASEQRAMQFLMSKGLTAEQAAGVVGNLVAESGGMNTAALGDNGSAFGLAQWRGDRRTALNNFAQSRGKANTDFDTQLEFMWQEMQQRGDLAAVQGTTSAAAAAEVFARKYERPRGVDGPLSGLAGWNERLSNAQRLAGSGTTQVDQSQLQGLLNQWKSTSIDQIKAQAEYEGATPDDLAQRLADFEVEARSYFNDVLTGNAARVKELLADASLREATDTAAASNTLLRNGQLNLDDTIQGINELFLEAQQAAIEAMEADFRAKGSEVDPTVAGQAAEERRKIQADFASKMINNTLAAIDAFFQGEADRAANDIERMRLGVERQRAGISALSNSWGQRNLGDTQRALGAMRGEQLDIDDSRINLGEAQGNYTRAVGRRDALQSQLNGTTDEVQRTILSDDLAEANVNVAQLANEMERAQLAFSSMTDMSPTFSSFTDAMAASWAVFADQAQLNKSMMEDVADGMVGVFGQAQSGFKTLVVDVLSGSKSMGAAFKDFTMSVLQSLLDLAAEILAKKILLWVVNMVAGGFGGGGGGMGMDSTGTAMLNGTSEFGGFLNGGGGLWHGGEIPGRRMAHGGEVLGRNPNRDSVNINAMPGEVLMSKSAVDMVGKDTLLALNSRGNSRLSAMPSMQQAVAAPAETNVYVVMPDKVPQLTKRDILVTVAEDILTNGTTKKLIKTVQAGG